MALVSSSGSRSIPSSLGHFCEWTSPGGCLSLKILLVFRTGVFYKLGQTESLWKSYQKSSPRGSFHQWFLKLSVAPEPRKQHCYQGVRKHWTQLRNGVLMRPKGAVLRAHLRDKQAETMRSAPGFLHVWKKEWTWHLKLGPCILATWQVSSWQGWVSLLYPTSFFFVHLKVEGTLTNSWDKQESYLLEEP